MKFLSVFGLAVVLLCAIMGYTSALPTFLDEIQDFPGTLPSAVLPEHEQQPETLHLRAKRLSCQIDKAVCTIHCWSLGKNTGHCDNGTCKCYNL